MLSVSAQVKTEDCLEFVRDVLCRIWIPDSLIPREIHHCFPSPTDRSIRTRHEECVACAAEVTVVSEHECSSPGSGLLPVRSFVLFRLTDQNSNAGGWERNTRTELQKSIEDKVV